MNEWYCKRHFSPDAGNSGGGPRDKRLNTVLMNSPFGGLNQLRELYFIGIGGIGMSAIARFFHEQGVKVSGYDRTPTTLTGQLEAAGIAIHYDEDQEKIPAKPDLVIYTPAIPAGHSEWKYYQSVGQKIVKRSDMLQIISESSFNICVAGTHGKTTISTMTAHILRHSGFGCNAFLGGISGNYGTNFWSHERNVCVIEADEFDRSFLKLSPDIAIISAIDADHLDIYGTAGDVEQAFIDFSRRVRAGGRLIAKHGLARSNDLRGENYLSYGVEEPEADASAENVRLVDGAYQFDVRLPGGFLPKLTLNMGGRHNVENVIAAITACWLMGVEEGAIREAVAAFRGVKRRFEFVAKTEDVVVVDDYAHHPEELRALLSGARDLFPDRKMILCFQPHLYSRTRDFAAGFSEVMSRADEVLLLPIYPARELPIEGVSSDMLLKKMDQTPGKVVEKKMMLDELQREIALARQNRQPLLILTAGAGDIDGLLEPIKEMI